MGPPQHRTNVRSPRLTYSYASRVQRARSYESDEPDGSFQTWFNSNSCCDNMHPRTKRLPAPGSLHASDCELRNPSPSPTSPATYSPTTTHRSTCNTLAPWRPLPSPTSCKHPRPRPLDIHHGTVRAQAGPHTHQDPCNNTPPASCRALISRQATPPWHPTRASSSLAPPAVG